jgi:hypothetical protein
MEAKIVPHTFGGARHPPLDLAIAVGVRRLAGRADGIGTHLTRPASIAMLVTCGSETKDMSVRKRFMRSTIWFKSVLIVRGLPWMFQASGTLSETRPVPKPAPTGVQLV